MQHLEELLSSVEVSKGLIENRKKDADIKLEEMKHKLAARKTTGEAMFDELIERLMVYKNQFSDAVDNQHEAILADLTESSKLFDEKLDYLEAILDQISQIQEVGTILIRTITPTKNLWVSSLRIKKKSNRSSLKKMSIK